VRDLRVECRFTIFISTPAGASELGQRSYELVSIEELLTPEMFAVDNPR